MHRTLSFTTIFRLMILLAVVWPRVDAQAIDTHTGKHGRLEVLVLGSGGPRAFGRAASSYAVLIDGVPKILVDAGPGAFFQMGRLGLDVSRLDTILLTHLHIDHSGDLPAVILARSLISKTPISFRVFGPASGGGFPSTTTFLHLLFDRGGAFEYERTFGVRENISGVDLDTDMRSNEQTIVEDNGVRILAIATHHGEAPSVAYRIEYGGGSVTFSGDMDESALPNLEKLATDSTLLIFNCPVLDAPGSPAELYRRHTPPKKIGEAARDTHVRQLLLSHIPPDVDRNKDRVLFSVRNSYKGLVRFAVDGMRVVVL
jgi:ribonuclease BN (tRNA processing enzyme)